jgi:hypothetical protein
MLNCFRFGHIFLFVFLFAVIVYIFWGFRTLIGFCPRNFILHVFCLFLSWRQISLFIERITKGILFVFGLFLFCLFQLSFLLCSLLCNFLFIFLLFKLFFLRFLLFFDLLSLSLFQLLSERHCVLLTDFRLLFIFFFTLLLFFFFIVFFSQDFSDSWLFLLFLGECFFQ